MRIRDLLVVGMGLVLVGGSSPGGESKPSTAGPPRVDGEETVGFNPCTQLSDEALRALQVDPASKGVGIDPPEGPTTFRSCLWHSTAGPYSLTVLSTVYSLDDMRKNTEDVDIHEAQIGPRKGVTFLQKGDDMGRDCYAGFPSGFGSMEVEISYNQGKKPPKPPCDDAVRQAATLVPFVPNPQ